MSDAVVNAIAGAIGGFFAALVGVLPLYFAYRLKMQEMQGRLTWESNQKESYRSIAKDSLGINEANVNKQLVKEGKPPLVPIADVIAEYQSPVTREAQEAADLQTARKRLVDVQLAMGIPARESGPPETEPQRAARQAVESRGDTPEALGTRLATTQVADLKSDVAKIPEKVADEIEKREGG